MEYHISPLEELKSRADFEISQEVLTEKVKSLVQKYKNKVSLPGFRPGKAPESAVLQQRKGPLLAEALEALSQEAYQALIQDKNLKIAGQAEMSVEKLSLEEGAKFSLVYEVYPEFDLPDLQKLDVERLSVEVTDEDVDKAIEDLRKRSATFEKVDRAAQKDDRATIDFKGFLGDEPFEGGEAKGEKVILGEGQFIPGFEDGLLGMSAGESKDIAVTFPEDYGHEKLKGQPARFEVTLHAVEARKLPELDEEFLKKFVKGEPVTLERFREETKRQIEREAERILSEQNKRTTYEALSNATSFPLPRSLVKVESERMRDGLMAQFRNQALNAQELPVSLFEKEAESKVRMSLALGKLIETFDIDPKDEEVEAFIQKRAKDYDKPELFVSHFKGNPERFLDMKHRLIEEQTLDLLFSKMNTKDTKKTYTELTQKKEAE